MRSSVKMLGFLSSVVGVHLSYLKILIHNLDIRDTFQRMVPASDYTISSDMVHFIPMITNGMLRKSDVIVLSR